MSKSAILAQGTTLHIAGTGGAAKSITGITAGNPTIITSAAHGLSNGDVVSVAGVTGADAALVNGLNWVVTNKTTNTFAIQIDSTGKTLTAAGTATPLSWTKVGEVKSIDPSGSTSSDIDVTDLDSTKKEFRIGLGDPGTITLEMNSLDADTGQAAMLAAHNSQVVKSFKMTYPSGATPVRTFDASVRKYPDLAKASVDGVLTGSIELRRSGAAVAS
ncbi:hypothetical protein KP003_16650 [Geomonas nitrogeniifigens]|uniref:phage tail tube protein n=1 Tax=Geomonas diazotrophica TaxID=2843197 RepID=UPI001C2C0DF4|nr:phage tail tube protein [Geomonas nitrogeniifigens]QXE85971.1 hypothetical protein KP003_16650 [Geomonas nitrogeniifigens]